MTQYAKYSPFGGGSGGGASAFTDLTDVPSSYTGQGNKIVTVKADESGLEFTTAAGGGNVTGPVTSTDTAIARYNGTGGTSIQDSSITISNTGVIAGGIQLTLRDDSDLSGAAENMIRLENRNSTATSHPHLEFRKAAASNANLTNGDEVGGINFHARHNSTTSSIADVVVQYTGNGTTRIGDMIFSTSNSGAPAERVRITGAGDIRVAGLTASRAVVTDADKDLVSSATTATQIGYLSGATGTTGTTTTNLVFSTSPTLVTPILGTPTSGTLTNCTGLPISTGVSGLAANVATFLATPSSTNLRAAMTDETGSGALVFASGAIGTPTSGTLTNCTGLPISTGVSGLGTGVATFLATPSSANLAAAVTGETGTGALVFGTSPTISTSMLLAGSTSGTVTFKPAATAGTWTMTLPTSGGTSGYALTTDGSGTCSWTAVPAAPSTSSQAGNFTAANNTIYLVSSASARNITLPAAAAGITFMIKDSTGSCETNNFTIVRAGSESIEGVAANKTLQTNWGSWTFVCDGTNWFIL